MWMWWIVVHVERMFESEAETPVGTAWAFPPLISCTPTHGKSCVLEWWHTPTPTTQHRDAPQIMFVFVTCPHARTHSLLHQNCKRTNLYGSATPCHALCIVQVQVGRRKIPTSVGTQTADLSRSSPICLHMLVAWSL